MKKRHKYTFERDPELERLYHSTKWKKTRAKILADRRGVCEECGKAILGRYVVHHKTPATPANFFDLDILELVCIECHNRLTFSEHIKRQRPQAPLLSGSDAPTFLPS